MIGHAFLDFVEFFGKFQKSPGRPLKSLGNACNLNVVSRFYL